jgi:ATP-dependent Clp endopeptidase proteolytic subunit ClpP
MGDTTVLDAATAVHHTATVDEPWDGPAAVKAMPNSAGTLRACHAWVDSDGDPDTKSSYKFPHHKTKGGPANLAGCRNGLARLSGSSIPDGDKAGVKRHLQAHLDDAKGSSDDQLEQTLAARLRIARPVAQLKQGRRDWYRIDNATADTATVHIYDEIGFWGITAADFAGELAAVTAAQIDLHINSPGGEVFDGVAIFNSLQQHPASVTVYVDGLAASAASFIAQAGDRRVMARNATMMIHDGAGLCIGNAGDLRQLADLLDKISNNIADIYAQRAGGDVADWRAAMLAETWYTAAEAVAAGLADEVAQAPARTAPDNTWNLSIFNYAGRDVAPPPATQPVPPLPPPPPPFDPAALAAALRKASA